MDAVSSVAPAVVDFIAKQALSKLTFSELVLLIVLIVAVYHLLVVRKNHREQRKKNALDAIRRFTEVNQVVMFGAIAKILSRMPPEDVKKILKFEQITVEPGLMPFIATVICSRHGMCQHKCTECAVFFEKEDENREIPITLHATIHFRRLVGTYLNSHEIIFSAWVDGIADKNLIEEEFRCIFENDANGERSKFSELLGSFDPDGKLCPNSWKFLDAGKRKG